MNDKWNPPPGWGQQPQPTQPMSAAPPPAGQPAYRPPEPRPSGFSWRKVLPIIAGVVGGLILGLVIGVAGDTTGTASKGSTPAPTVTVTVPTPAAAAPETATSVAPEPAAGVPKPADFKLTVKILSKQCFGSAGCNITFRIEPAYAGPPVDSDTEYRVIYVVTGGESGPQTNSFTLRGDEAEYPSEEIISTKSSKVRLTAKVSEVLKN